MSAHPCRNTVRARGGPEEVDRECHQPEASKTHGEIVVRTARLPRQMPAMSAEEAAWETGADIQWLKGLRQYWTKQFDWRAAEVRLNRYPQYKARVDGVAIHIYYVKGEGSNPLPLLLTHGWPGSVVEFLDVIGPLTQPS